MAINLEIRHLKTLRALEETDSLVEAAQRMFLTQSALSHQIKDLEDRIGSPLFIRKTKPIRFTSAGQRILALASEVLPRLRHTERELARLSGGETGRLHMAIECHSCYQWLMPTINTFREHWPDVELDLASGFNFEPLAALSRGDLDLVVTSNPTSKAGVVYKPLFKYESRLAVHKQHPLATKDLIEPKDLEEETLIIYPVEQNRLDIFTQFLHPADIHPKSLRESELTIMMIQLVASGRGVCALPNWALTEYLEKDYVISRQLGTDGIWCTLYAAIREDQADASYMEEFVKTAKESCFENLKGIRPIDAK